MSKLKAIFENLFNIFGKAVKTKNGLRYFRIPDIRKPTKGVLKFWGKQISYYEEEAAKGKDNFKEHLIFLYGMYLEYKRQIYPKYCLTDIDKERSFDYIKWQLRSPIELIDIKKLKDKDDKNEIDQIFAQKDKIITDHFEYVWGIKDKFIIVKLLEGILNGEDERLRLVWEGAWHD